MIYSKVLSETKRVRWWENYSTKQTIHEIVSECNCKDDEGCPRCIRWEGCVQYNSGLNKKDAQELLKSLIMPKLEKVEIRIGKQIS